MHLSGALCTDEQILKDLEHLSGINKETLWATLAAINAKSAKDNSEFECLEEERAVISNEINALKAEEEEQEYILVWDSSSK